MLVCASTQVNQAACRPLYSDFRKPPMAARHRTQQRRSLLRNTDILEPMSSVLGLISDTHGLLRPAALAALRGSNIIIHAGDIGDPAILDQLRTIAPVFGVRGNVDRGDWATKLPLRETVDVEGSRIYVLHDLHDIDLDPKFCEISIVVSGHTHQPESHWHNGVLYINPGSAGPKRFSLPISLARLDLLKTPWQPEFISLSVN
jgi:uncharacterized protein